MRSDGFERFAVEEGTFRRDGLVWWYKVEAVRVHHSLYYELTLENLTDQTLANAVITPNLPDWDGEVREVGSLVPGREVRIAWQWNGMQIPNGVHIKWDGGKTLLTMWD